MGSKLISLRSAFLSIGPLLAVLLLANNALATPAGSVIFAKGPVTAEREPSVALTKGDEVLVEDTVATGAAGRAQLLMLDGAKIAIRPNSRLRIEEVSSKAVSGPSLVRSAKPMKLLTKCERPSVFSGFAAPTIWLCFAALIALGRQELARAIH